VERFEQAIAEDRGATPIDVYFARLKQVGLCNSLAAWEDSLRYAEMAARVAPLPELRVEAEHDAAVAELNLCEPGFRCARSERVLARYTSLQEQVEGPGGLLARSQKIEEGWGSTYLEVLNMRSHLLARRGAREEAKQLAEKALRLFDEGRIPANVVEDFVLADFLARAMILAARDKDKARAERYLLRLAELPGRNTRTAEYVEKLAEAEREWGGEEAYAARMTWWLRRVGPSDPSWAPVLYTLALNQSLRKETRPAAAQSYEQLLSAYEKNPPPAGVGWPNIQTHCWLNLADLYSEDSAGLRNMPRARELAQRYLDATKDDKSAAVQRNRAKMEELLRAAEPGAPR